MTTRKAKEKGHDPDPDRDPEIVSPQRREAAKKEEVDRMFSKLRVHRNKM